MENVTLETSIAKCGLSSRLKNALQGAEINIIRDFVRFWEESEGIKNRFCVLRNCGNLSYEEAKKFASSLLKQGVFDEYSKEIWEQEKTLSIEKFALDLMDKQVRTYRLLYEYSESDVRERAKLLAEKIAKDLLFTLQ